MDPHAKLSKALFVFFKVRGILASGEEGLPDDLASSNLIAYVMSSTMESFDNRFPVIVNTHNQLQTFLSFDGKQFDRLPVTHQPERGDDFPSTNRVSISRSRTFKSATEDNGQPKDLFDIVLQYVSENITNVDSLIGCPELIGEEIFTQCLFDGMFTISNPAAKNSKTAEQILRMFSKSYKSSVLNKLCLRDSTAALDKSETFLRSILQHVTVLDVSGCYIGAGHFLLKEIGSMSRLTGLNLRNTSLQKESFRQLTLPCSMFNRGPTKLKELSLADNTAVSKSDILRLKCFKNMVYLDISNTAVQENDVRVICQALKMTRSHRQDERSCHLDNVKTEGWAAELVEFTLSSSTSEESKDSGEHDAVLKFYNLKRKRQESVEGVPRKRTKTESASKNSRIILLKLVESSVNDEVSVRSSTICLRSNAETDDDKLLLNLYGDPPKVDSSFDLISKLSELD